jgi:hypothetical protein
MACTFKAAAFLLATVLLVGAQPLSAPGVPVRELAVPSAEPPAPAPPPAPVSRLIQRPARELEDAVGRAEVNEVDKSISLHIVSHCDDEPSPLIITFVEPYRRKTVSRKCKKTGVVKRRDYVLQCMKRGARTCARG